MVGVWNFGFLFLSVCINTVTYLLSEVSYFCRHVYLLKLSECLAKPQRMCIFYRISICFAWRKIENQQMSQKYPASVCSLSSFWTTVPPCCVCTLHYTSVCCQRQVCKICGSAAHWCGKAFVVQVLGFRESCGPPWRIPCQSQALLPWGPGLSAAPIRPNDAVWPRAGNEPRRWSLPALPSAHSLLLPFVGDFALCCGSPGALTGPRLRCAAAGKREGVRIQEGWA